MPYPETPGSKTGGTSAESARKVAGVAEILRTKCLAALKVQPMTADELAARMDESPFSIRPRVSELKRMGLIADTGHRRVNLSGHRAAVWKSTQP